MDVEEYRAARRTRLVERAVELGLPADDAGLVVDRVIAEQRRRIRRAEDPDDVVVPALRDAILRGGTGTRTTTLVVLLVLAAIVLAVPVAYVARNDPAPVMPSLFGLTTTEATRALERDDIASRVVDVPQCNPAGQVLGSDPLPGSAVGVDDVVTLIATSTPEWRCPDDAAARERAWTFLRFLVSGTARPGFAPGVRLFVDGEEVTVVGGAEPVAAPGWQSVVRDPVLAYASRPAANPLGQPVVSISYGVPPPTTCGHPRATPAGAVLPSTRVVLTAGGESSSDACGLTIDLFDNVLGAISGVALYTPRRPGT
ncbi:hypothetical protein CFI00_05405 [Nocardioides sp. S5]|uniref:PASTA domain-containing protein n=1 Tax=Nocardioides sp. S5 TaxID=2017486 RepID=UPI001A8D18A0|nr:PASTA domain-containing protein [Nocardioides sp. S5]QSR29954.1 hypothetical protein CFI00_05405 [Nocardioides sp. S5]